nr:MAG TPA: hypothetical protein [Caudoviricetes sp.]
MCGFFYWLKSWVLPIFAEVALIFYSINQIDVKITANYITCGID